MPASLTCLSRRLPEKQKGLAGVQRSCLTNQSQLKAASQMCSVLQNRRGLRSYAITFVFTLIVYYILNYDKTISLLN